MRKQTRCTQMRLRRAWLRLGRELAPRAQAISTVNQLIAQELKERYGLVRSPNVFENVCRFHERTMLQPGLLRDICGLDQERLMVCAGEVRPGRRLEDFIRSLAHMPSDTGLVFLGYCSETYRTRMRKLATQVGVEDRLSIGTSVPSANLVSVLSGASLGLISNRGPGPNNTLGGPNRLYEYIQARIPIFSHEHKGIGLVLQQTGTGLCRRWEDPRDLAGELQRGMADLAAVPEAAFEVAAQNYSWERFEEDFLTLTARLLSHDDGSRMGLSTAGSARACSV